jgi:archaellum component FlaC
MEAMPRQSWTDDRMDDLAQRVDLRFDHVDERFDRVDERFKAMDERFDRVDDEIKGVRSELREDTRELRQAIEAQGSELNRRFETLQKTLLGGFLGVIGAILTPIAGILVAHLV